MQLRGLRSVTLDGVDIGMCGPVEFEPITDPLIPNIITLPTRISGGFQCAPISQEFIDAIVGPPAPLTISMVATFKRTTWKSRRAARRAHRRAIRHDLRLIQQGKPRVFRYAMVGRLKGYQIRPRGDLFSVAMEVEVEQA